MKNKQNRFQILRQTRLFAKWPVFLTSYEIQMPSGLRISRQILDHTDAVVILPRLRRDRYFLIRQFRFAARDWLWEFPAGGVEKHESLRQAAKRELIEEIGHRPKRLTKLISFYPTPGVSAEVMHLYLAEHLIPEKGEADPDEEIEVHEFSGRQIEKMIRKKTIVDGKTIAGFLYLKHFL